MTTTSSHSCGSILNHTVSAKNTSAPMLRKFLPGSISGADLMRADSLRLATIQAGECHRADEDADEHLGQWMPVAYPRRQASSASGLFGAFSTSR